MLTKTKNQILISLLLGQCFVSTQVLSMDRDDKEKRLAISKAKPTHNQSLELAGASTYAPKIVSLAQQNQDDQERIIRNAALEVRDQNLRLDRRLDASIEKATGPFKYELIYGTVELHQENDTELKNSGHLNKTSDSSSNYSHDETGSSTYRKGGVPKSTFLCGLISWGGEAETLSVTAPRSHTSRSSTSHEVYNEKQLFSLIAKRKFYLKIIQGSLAFECTNNIPKRISNYSHQNEERLSLVRSNVHNNTTRNNARPSEITKQITYAKSTSVKPENGNNRLVNNREYDCEVRRPAPRQTNPGRAQLAQSQNKKADGPKKGEKK